MLKTRIIPVLLLKNGRMVKGKQFAGFRDVGDPVSAARIYNAQNADELAFLDIEASGEGRKTLLDVVGKVSKECFMPLAVGGGVTSVEDVRELLRAGADKVIITSAAVENPELICQAARIFGNQCVIGGVDVKREGEKYFVYTHSGKIKTNLDLIAHLRDLESRGAGELFVNSIDRDGMMQGCDLELASVVKENTRRPAILCGGAGHFMHLADAVQKAGVHAVACASLFHFGDNNPVRARSYLKNLGVPVKNIK